MKWKAKPRWPPEGWSRYFALLPMRCGGCDFFFWLESGWKHKYDFTYAGCETEHLCDDCGLSKP